VTIAVTRSANGAALRQVRAASTTTAIAAAA